MTVWTHELLDALRQIGDPALDPVRGKGGWREVAHCPPADEVAGRTFEEKLLKTWRLEPHGAMPEPKAAAKDLYWTSVSEPMDPVKLEIAYSLFVVYGGEIAASLLLASLPNAYAAEAGAAVLATTKELESNARRRIAETAQLVVDVLFPSSERFYGEPESEVMERPAESARPSLLPGGRAYVRVRTTRLTHAVIREVVTEAARNKWTPKDSAQVPRHENVLRGVPINQEDLLGTLGTFTVTVFEVMEKLGIPWSDEAEAAYLYHWDRVGELLGIGTPEVIKKLPKSIELPPEYRTGLRPKSVADARQMQEMIRDRCWPLPVHDTEMAPFANANGKLLVRALLDELQDAMPRGMERLPLFVMRYLVHDAAHELLGLGGGGVPDSLLRWPSEQRFTRGASGRVGKTVIERAMRLAATDVSRRSFVHFIRERKADDTQADFWFPAVRDHWINGGHGPE